MGNFLKSLSQKDKKDGYVRERTKAFKEKFKREPVLQNFAQDYEDGIPVGSFDGMDQHSSNSTLKF